MITLYTVPRDFEPPFDLLQANAIRSWLALTPTPQVILIGDNGIRNAAAQLGVQFSESDGDLPTVRHAIETAEEMAVHPVRCFLNTDNVLFPSFYEVLQPVLWQFEQFVCIGRRTNLDVEARIDSTSREFADEVEQRGTPGGWTGMDYFIYRGVSLSQDMPDFKIGADCYDNWIVREIAQSTTPLINVSEVLTVVHENHPPKPGLAMTEIDRNHKLAKIDKRYGIKTANWRLVSTGLIGADK